MKIKNTLILTFVLLIYNVVNAQPRANATKTKNKSSEAGVYVVVEAENKQYSSREMKFTDYLSNVFKIPVSKQKEFSHEHLKRYMMQLFSIEENDILIRFYINSDQGSAKEWLNQEIKDNRYREFYTYGGRQVTQQFMNENPTMNIVHEIYNTPTIFDFDYVSYTSWYKKNRNINSEDLKVISH